MHNRLTTYIRFAVQRRYARVVAFAVLGLVIGALVVWRFTTVVYNQKAVVENPDVEIFDESSSDSDVLVMTKSKPMGLSIPAIGLRSSFVDPLGLADNGEVEVPDSYQEVGYYKYGPTPGELGPAVVLGHVDSYQGPAVFYSLGQLAEGDEILIDREDGTTAVFIVEQLERHAQSAFPTAKVYGDLSYAGLRLITCSGEYNRGTERYSHNLIVYARLASSTSVDNIDF